MAGLYYPHDLNARNDPKCVRLRMTTGAAGYGVFNILLELLGSEPSHTLPTDYEAIAWAEHLDAELIRQVVNDFDLFVITDDGSQFYSRRMLEQFEAIDGAKQRRTNAAKKGASARWGNADAMQTQCDCYANAEQPQSNSNADAMPMQCDCDAKKRLINNNLNKINTSCGEQTSLPPAESYAEQPRITQFNIVLNDKSLYDVTEQELQEWRGLYPAVDVEQELRNMHGWADANPKQRKTRAGIRRFITAWLSKAQDKARCNNVSKSAYTGAGVTFGDDNPMYRRD